MTQDEQLHNTFNLDPDEHEGYEEENAGIEFPMEDIPAHLDLDTIAYMAVHSYKQQLQDINELPLKQRQRALEVAQNYLSLAKDSIHKRDDLEIKALSKKSPKQINTNDDDEESESKTISRNEAYERLNNNETT